MGLFNGWFKKADAARPSGAPPEPPRPRVVLEGMSRALDIPPPKQDKPVDTLRQELRYQALHEDINPSTSVRAAEMTCPNCERHFRYFLNADGKKTVVKCPGCAQPYRL